MVNRGKHVKDGISIFVCNFGMDRLKTLIGHAVLAGRIIKVGKPGRRKGAILLVFFLGATAAICTPPQQPRLDPPIDCRPNVQTI